MKSLTTMPRFTSRPASRPSAALGLMPAAITTSSASSSSPVAKRRPIHVAVAEQSGRLPGQHHPDAEAFDAPLQILAARGIQLALHQRIHEVNHRDLAAAHLQTARRFQAQQSAADDHRFQTLAALLPAAPGCRRACGRRARFLCRRPESAE